MTNQQPKHLRMSSSNPEGVTPNLKVPVTKAGRSPQDAEFLEPQGEPVCVGGGCHKGTDFMRIQS